MGLKVFGAVGSEGRSSAGLLVNAIRCLSNLAVILGFEKLPVQSRQSIDDRVLGRVERKDFVPLGIIDQALFISANLRLQFRNSLLQKIARSVGELGLLFEIREDERVGHGV